SCQTHSLSSCAAASPPLHSPALHGALPISERGEIPQDGAAAKEDAGPAEAAPKLSAAERRAAQKELQRIERRIDRISAREEELQDRKSTRLNSSHVKSSYAVFCLKKKRKSQ